MQDAIPGQADPAEVHRGPFGRTLVLVAKLFAITGGLAFVGLVVMSIISIVGRKLASAPVPGDVEILQMVAAAASASFFAWCHLNQGDVKVDFFTASAPPYLTHGLDAFGSLLVALFAGVLTWRIVVAALIALEDGEASAILDWPVGWAQMAMAPGFGLLALAGLYMAAMHGRLALAARAGEAR